MSVSNCDDVIDSRDVIERIEELQEERDAYEEDGSGTWGEDDAAELASLEALQDEAEGYSEDWRYGATLIRDSYFVQYCRELVKDIGDIPSDLPSYLANNIDWQGVADDLRVDYTEVDFDGVTYLIR